MAVSTWQKGRNNTMTSGCGGSLFYRRRDKDPFGTIMLDFPAFVEWLRQQHSRTIAWKTQNQYFSPSIYDPDIPNPKGRKRGKVNIVGSLGIWLDNDGGVFSPEQFAVLFPILQFVATNTYTTTSTRRKYRLVISTDSLMSSEVYELIAKHIVARIAEVCPDHGFDIGKLHAASMLLLPCQAKQRGASFFQVYDDPSGKPFNVTEWVRAAIDAEKEPEPCRVAPPVDDPEKQRRVEKVRTKWRNGCHDEGHDYTPFYKLGLSLMGYCRCDEAETRSILSNEASYSHNPKGRLKQIDDIIEGAREKIKSAAE